MLTTIGEVHFLATPLSAFPGLNKVNKRFRVWLTENPCVYSHRTDFVHEWDYYLEGSAKNWDPIFALPDGMASLRRRVGRRERAAANHSLNAVESTSDFSFASARRNRIIVAWAVARFFLSRKDAVMKKLLLLAALAFVAGPAVAAAPTEGMAKGTPAMKSVSALAFGPGGVLFVGDPQSATIFAVDTADTKEAGKGDVMVDKIDEKIAAMLGIVKADLTISDMKVNPASGNIYLSVTRGKGAGSVPVLLKFDRTGAISEFATKDVMFSEVKLPNASDKQRQMAITGMAYVDGKLVVAGLSNEEFASTLRTIPFPFKEADKGAGIEIFHGNHGRLETNSPVRTFTPYNVSGTEYLLAAYTCTPLVQIPISDLKPGAKVKGKTIAELGNRNNPLDMIVYQKDGKDYLLMANRERGVMKIPTEGITSAASINAKVPTEKAGLGYESIKELQGTVQLDKLDAGRALVLIQTPPPAMFGQPAVPADKISLTMKSIPLP